MVTDLKSIGMIVAETPRLILRHLTWEDLDELATLYADPVVMKFMGGAVTYENTKQQLEGILDSYEKNGFGLWATIHKADNQFIGRCGLLLLEIDGRQEIEIGYLLAQPYWGQGLATEAARAVRDYGLKTLDLERLISLIDLDNFASQKVPTKNGLTYEKNIAKWGKILRLYAIHKEDEGVRKQGEQGKGTREKIFNLQLSNLPTFLTTNDQ